MSSLRAQGSGWGPVAVHCASTQTWAVWQLPTHHHGTPAKADTGLRTESEKWQLSSRIVNQKQLASYVRRKLLTDRRLRVVTRKNECGKGRLSVRLTCSTHLVFVGVTV